MGKRSKKREMPASADIAVEQDSGKLSALISGEEDAVQEHDGVEQKNEVRPMIHILVRTHRRPNYFKKCIESIFAQDYGSRMVHVIADDFTSEQYAKAALAEGIVDNIVRVYPAAFWNKFGDFGALKRDGICKSDKDFKRHHYDLYLNDVMEQIDDGWIFIVDDDKVLPTPNVLTLIAEHISDENTLIVGQYGMKSRKVPDGELWGKVPFTRAHIDMSCVVFHTKHKSAARLDGHGAGDWRMANRLAALPLNLVWIREPLTVADNNGNFGKGE